MVLESSETKTAQKPTSPSDLYPSSTSSSTLTNLPLLVNNPPTPISTLSTHYFSCTTTSAKNGVIRSLTSRAYNICSPQHLDSELQTVRHVSLLNTWTQNSRQSVTCASSALGLRTPDSASRVPPQHLDSELQTVRHVCLLNTWTQNSKQCVTCVSSTLGLRTPNSASRVPPQHLDSELQTVLHVCLLNTWTQNSKQCVTCVSSALGLRTPNSPSRVSPQHLDSELQTVRHVCLLSTWTQNSRQCVTFASSTLGLRTPNSASRVSPQHLDSELQTVRHVCLLNTWTQNSRQSVTCASSALGLRTPNRPSRVPAQRIPSQQITTIMEEVGRKFLNPSQRQTSTSQPPGYSLSISLPYHPSLSKPLKKILRQHDIKVRNSSLHPCRTSLPRQRRLFLLTSHPTLSTRFPALTATLHTTARPADLSFMIHRTKEHERCHRLNNACDDTLEEIKSAPANQSHTTGQRIAWNDINILKALSLSRSHLDLREHAAIHIRHPSMNIEQN